MNRYLAEDHGGYLCTKCCTLIAGWLFVSQSSWHVVRLDRSAREWCVKCRKDWTLSSIRIYLYLYCTIHIGNLCIWIFLCIWNTICNITMTTVQNYIKMMILTRTLLVAALCRVSSTWWLGMLSKPTCRSLTSV